MIRENLEAILKQLVDLHNIPLKYYTASRKNPSGWNEVNIRKIK